MSRANILPRRYMIIFKASRSGSGSSLSWNDCRMLFLMSEIRSGFEETRRTTEFLGLRFELKGWLSGRRDNDQISSPRRGFVSSFERESSAIRKNNNLHIYLDLPGVQPWIRRLLFGQSRYDLKRGRRRRSHYAHPYTCPAKWHLKLRLDKTILRHSCRRWRGREVKLVVWSSLNRLLA